MSEGSKAYGRGQVIDIINSVITKMDTGGGPDKREIYLHIAELAELIDSLKKDIAAHRPDHVKNSHIPDANDELDAVIEATAVATNSIMGICENIEAFSETLEPEKASELTGHVTQIYEACTFQDITGQRIKKVVSTLRQIEERIDNIIGTLDEKVGPMKMAGGRLPKEVSVDDEQSLLNGPQMADKAISQEEIDRLLAEFDN